MRSRTTRVLRLLLASAWLALPANARAQAMLTALEPGFAPPGGEVTLHGVGFDPGASTSVSVSGAAATVLEVQPGFVRFAVPSVASGPVEVQQDGGPVRRYPRDLSVVRALPAGIDPALAPLTAGYVRGSVYGDATAGAPVEVATGEPSLVVAAGDETGSDLYAIATDTTSSLVLGAASTAQAAVFLSSRTFVADPAQADARLALIAGLDGTQALAAIVATALAEGRDWLADPGFPQAYADAHEQLDALLFPPDEPPPPPAPPPNAPEWVPGVYDFAPGSPRDIPERSGLAGLNHVDASRAETNVVYVARGLPTRGVKLDGATQGTILGVPIGANPLEWIANLYELDPYQFESEAQFDAIEYSNDVYTRALQAPYGRVLVGANAAQTLDIVGYFTKLLTARFQEAPPSLRLQVDRPGLYIVRSFSGAYFPEQAPLVGGLPGGRIEDVRAAELNIVLGALELVQVVIKASDVIGEQKVADIAMGVQLAVHQSLEQKSAEGTLNSFTLAAISFEAAKAITLAVVDELRDAGIESFGRIGKLAKAVADPFAKVSTGASGAYRFLALTNAFGGPRAFLSQAVETTTVQIGDPFAPVIEDFRPVRAHRGAVVMIRGRGFSGDPGELDVLFNPQGTGDPCDAPAAPAEILVASDYSLLVRVPDVPPPALPDGPGPLVVCHATRGSGSSAPNEPPNDAFTLLPDPVLFAIAPDPPIVGQPMVLYGANLAPLRERNGVEIDVGGTVQSFIAHTLGPNQLTISGPTTILPSSARIRIGAELDFLGAPGPPRYSNPLPFTALPGQCDDSGDIVVTSALDNTAADGAVTLREALGWAGGTLARQPTEDELGWITPPYGPGIRDRITALSGLAGATVQITSGVPLPPVSSCDVLDRLDLTVDGGGLSGAGLSFAGAERATVDTLRLRNFAGPAVHLPDAVGNQLLVVSAEAPCQVGFLLEGNTVANRILLSGATDCDTHGVHFSGPGVVGNACEYDAGPTPFAFSISGHGQYGMLADGGASGNVLACGHATGNAAGGVRIAPNSPGNHVGIADQIAVGLYMDVTGNGFPDGGAGVRVESADTGVRLVRASGNNGDGILIEGTHNTASSIDGVIAGIDASGTLPQPNLGSGIHVRDQVSWLVIGSGVNQINAPPRNAIGGNRDHGIWLEGPDVHDVLIRRSLVGASHTPAPPFFLPALVPNGLHGIALTGGTHDNWIGDWDTEDARVEVVGHGDADSLGISISGTGTQRNTIASSFIGTLHPQPFGPPFAPPPYGNRIGVLVSGGAFANQIGVPGDTLFVPLGPFALAFTAQNSIANASEAGIVLESGGDPGVTTAPNTPPVGANLVRNNRIGSTFQGNQVGLILRAQGLRNRIGGTGDGEGNTFAANRQAGLLIDGVIVPGPNSGNRIVGNVFVDNAGPVLPPDPLAAPPDGVGVLIRGGASGHLIGGDDPKEGNAFARNSVGVYLSGGSTNALRNNRIGYADTGNPASLAFVNRMAGVVVSGCAGCSVGPGNQINGNGRGFAGPRFGGVALRGGGANRVVGNWVGTDPGETIHLGNDPYGIYASESGANSIGDPGPGLANVVVASIADGVRIEGAASNVNHLASSFVGRLSRAPLIVSNGGAGVRILGGASANLIGHDLLVPLGNALVPQRTGNHVWGNVSGGVVVNGAATLRNTITNNSITLNTGLGIDNQSGGNTELAPPLVTSVSDLRAHGLSSAPNQSLVQVWSDPDGEGRTLIGEGELDGGAFSIAILPAGGPVTATVTSADTGDTSEFSAPVVPAIGLFVERDEEVTVPATHPAGARDALVLPLRLSAVNAAIEVASLRVTASGTLDDAAHVAGVSVWLDVDLDGEVSEPDERLGGPDAFSADDGEALVALAPAALTANTSERWLVAYDLDVGAPAGAELQAALADPSKVSASLLLASGATVTATGPFPIESDPIALTAPLDTDGDATPDASDNCPFRANPTQSDANDNGDGDACECGDVAGPGASPDGLVDGSDAARMRAHLAASPVLPPALAEKCSVVGHPDGCNVRDWVHGARFVAGQAPGLLRVCRALVGP